MQYLLGEGQFSNREEHRQPTLILLDLKLPRKNGFEFLEWVKTEPRLRLIPVVVYTSSSQLSDIHRAYRLGANSYIVKTADFQKMEENVKVLLAYWAGFCECVNVSG
jgi:CheY-like chemotaxis protein